MARLEQHLPDQPRFDKRVGLLAGGGRFPVLFAQAAQKKGMDVVCVGIEGNAEPTLAQEVSIFHWNGVARLGSMIRKFKREGIRNVVMAGKIQKKAMYDRWRIFRHLPDWRFLRVFLSSKRRDNRDDSLLLALVDEFERDGIRIASALEVCPELLASAGVLTQHEPHSHQLADIAFGWRLAKEMGRLDVGQSVAVRERAVIAVEAIEGTDRAIERAGLLCPSGGFTVVKVAKPQQDMRFDVPAVGLSTIETMKQAGASCLAIEADKTIIIDADETVALADRYGISIVALSAEKAEQWGGHARDESALNRRDKRLPA